MDALDVLRVCLRRWYVVLPILMVAAGTGYALAANQKASYHASSSFAFVFQSVEAVPQDQRALNPLENTDLLGTALGLSLAAPEMQEDLGDVDASGVGPGEASDGTRFAFSGTGYTYTVEAWGPTVHSVETTVQNVMDAIPDEVERIQAAAGAPEGTLSTIFVMSPTRVEEIPPSSGLKLMIGVGAVGAIAGAALSIALDSMLSRRSRRRHVQGPEPLDADQKDEARSRADGASMPSRSRARRGVAPPQDDDDEATSDAEPDARAAFETLFR